MSQCRLQLSTDSPGGNGHPSCRDLINQRFEVRCVLFSKCIDDVDTQDNYCSESLRTKDWTYAHSRIHVAIGFPGVAIWAEQFNSVARACYC